MLKKGDSVGLVCCSDGIRPEAKQEIQQLEGTLREMGLNPMESPYLYRGNSPESGTPAQRAEALMEFYRNPDVGAIFDISGGNLANQILDKLDFKEIAASGKELWGYSDLTVLLNGIYAKTGNLAWLYQVRMLVGKEKEQQRRRFCEGILQGEISAFLPGEWHFLQGNKIEGIVLGGNIRCFLKLAGTPYFPDLKGKVLFLESLGGGREVISSLLAQLRQTGAFEKIQGLLLGTFTELDRQEGRHAVEELVKEAVQKPGLPIARTLLAGHGADSAALHLGTFFSVSAMTGNTKSSDK